MSTLIPSPQSINKIKSPQTFTDTSEKWQNANAKNAYAKKIYEDEERLRQICRKQLTLQGVQGITKFIKEHDLSCAQFVISITKKYLQNAFKFWTRPAQQIKKSIHELMVILNCKLNALPLPFMLNQFQLIKRQYQNVSKKHISSPQKPQMSKYDTQQKARQFLNEQKDKYENIQSLDIHGMKAQQQIKPEKKLYIIQTNQFFGTNWKQSKIAIWKEIYLKIQLQFESKRKLLSTEEGRIKIQNIISEKQSNQSQDKLLLTKQEKMVSQAVPLTDQKQQNQYNKKPPQNSQQRIINQFSLLKNVEKRASADRDCLGCTKFFYESDDLTFPIPKQAVTYVHSRKNMDNIWREIVAYLNNKGGIILIGCKQENEKIVPNIQDIPQHEKEQLQNKIHSVRSCIFPAITIDKHLLIKFVPIAQDPRKFPLLNEPQWIKGAYILRLTVVPLQPQSLYFYNYKTNENKTVIYFYRQIQQQCCKIQGFDIYDFMKKRYRLFGENPKESTKDQSRTQFKDPFLRHKDPQLPALFYHNYTCRLPEKGEQNFGKIDYYPVTERVDIKEQNPLQATRKNFTSVSLIVMDKTALEEAIHLFKNIGKHDIQIDNAFPDHQFMLSNTTFLLWHNCKFEKLMSTLKNTDGQAALKSKNKKATLLINTVKSLLLDKDLTQAHKEIIKQQTRIQAKQPVQFKQVKVPNGTNKDQTKYYIRCQSVITAVYLYFFINSKFKDKQKAKYKVKFDKITSTPVVEAAKPNNKQGNLTKEKEAKPRKQENKFQQKNNYQNKKYKLANQYQQYQKQEEYPAYDYTKEEVWEQQYPSTNIYVGQQGNYLPEVTSQQPTQNAYTPYSYPYPPQFSQLSIGNMQQPPYTIQNGLYCYYYSNGIIDYYYPNQIYYGSSYYNIRR